MAKKSFSFKAKHKSKKGGLTEAGRKAHNRATGSNLKRPQPEGGSRKKSYCARSKGQMQDHNINCKETPDKRICLARRRWKCRKSLQKSDMAPKQKLASFLREHIDNKLALKAAEPTITKSNESYSESLEKDLLPGGKGDTKDISNFDAKEVEMGMKVELEHTKDINVAKEIVADHLSEDPAYYSKLKGSGLADELNKAGRCWDGYEPTPGKKPYSKGSCRKIKKSELNKSDVSLHLINQFEGSPTSPTEHHYAVKQKGQEVGRAIVFDKDPKSIHNVGKIGPSLKDIRLKPEHQGKGLSGQVINKLVEAHGPLASDSRGNISEAGVKMFNKYGTKQLDGSYVLSGGKMQKTSHQKLIKALECKRQEKELKKSISAMAIESGEYKNEPLDSHHHNRIGQEYRGMAKQAHTEGNRNKAREYHEKALMHFKKADEMGFQQKEPLEKKISGKLVGAGLAALSSFHSPSTSNLASQVPQATAPVDVSKVPDIKKPDEHKQAISMQESSGGTKLVHPWIDKNKTERAISQYGMTPSRVIELYARSPEFRSSKQGKQVGSVVDSVLSKFKKGNFYNTTAFIEQTPLDVQKNLFGKINEITRKKENDDAIFDANKKHSLKELSHLTKDPIELDIMAAHAHHWFWPTTKSLYKKGGISAVINHDESAEGSGNYVGMYNQHLPENSPVKKKIEQHLKVSE